MMELRTLLERKGIRTVVIIDDVYDEAPRQDELSPENWSIFFDDLGEVDHGLLADIFPEYTATGREDLQASDSFISVLWENRSKLGEKCVTLFGEYEATNASERNRLDEIVKTLQGLGLTCTTMGRKLLADAKQADLVFVDLFLGFRQSEADMEGAVKRVSSLIEGRFENPPLVVLMSRSSRLWEKRNEFRDQACLHASTFRVISKNDLATEGNLATLLTRLASHYEDAKRVAGFVHAWDKGLTAARDRFVRILRRLDLVDLAQLKSLLLDFEGEALGEYLLDMSDRVLQYEIEADEPTMAAANELSKIDLSKYPAPHLAGLPDLQDLVHRMVFQHEKRLQLSENGETFQVLFGDVYLLATQPPDKWPKKVCLVVTSTCDLVRADDQVSALLLPGELRRLTAADWSYQSGVVRTSIFIADGVGRTWIKWDLKNRHTSTINEIIRKVKDGELKRIGRVRDLYAIEIQQKLLAEMGRIGKPANPPATFSVGIKVFRVAEEKSAAVARTVEIPDLEGAVCYVGRDKDSKRVDHLVLNETACDALRKAAVGLQEADVHPIARPSLKALKADTEFFRRFESGILEIPQGTNTYKEQRVNGLILLQFVRNGAISDGDSVEGSRRNGPLIIKIDDIRDSSSESLVAGQADLRVPV